MKFNLKYFPFEDKVTPLGECLSHCYEVSLISAIFRIIIKFKLCLSLKH